MNLIDVTYFKFDPIKINGLESSNGFSAELSNSLEVDLQRAIAIYEKPYLIGLLGSDLYEEYVASINNAKWDNLKAQLVNADLKRSPIANYVYYHFMKAKKYAYGDIGAYIPKVENMNNVDQNLVLKQAWNDGVAQNFEVCQWLSNNAEAQGWDNSVDETGWSVLLKRQSLFA